MNVIDLHPEDLLDKEIDGELTDAERARLDAHLERCEVCSFERDARADFADELDPPSKKPISVPVPVPIPVPAARKRRHWLLVPAAATFVLIGGIATAHQADLTTRLVEMWTAPAPVQPTATLAVPSPPRTSTIVSAAAPLPTPTPIVSVVAPAPAPTPEPTAANLLDLASESGRNGDYTKAISLHRRLQTTYPRSREAHASQAALGRLLLDRHDPQGALEAFDSYQRRGPGPLDESVLVGRATALERLGRVDEARATWAELVTSFPQSPYADHARRRSRP